MWYITKHAQFGLLGLEDLMQIRDAMLLLDDWDFTDTENLQDLDMILDEIEFRVSQRLVIKE